MSSTIFPPASAGRAVSVHTRVLKAPVAVNEAVIRVFDPAYYTAYTIAEVPALTRAPKRVTEVTTKPDVDKLARAALDALTGVLWADDSQVVSLHAQKEYAGEAQPCGALFVVRTGSAADWGRRQS